MHLEGVVLSRDGGNRLYGSVDGEFAEAIELGRRLAGLLLDRGAAELIRAARFGAKP
jgi:porphobilinogen deaminase